MGCLVCLAVRYSERFTVQAALISCTHEVCQSGTGVSLSSGTRKVTDTRPGVAGDPGSRIPASLLAASWACRAPDSHVDAGGTASPSLGCLAAWLPRLPCLPLCTSMRSRRYRDRISNHGVTPHARKQARRYPNTSHRCLATVVGKVIAWHAMLVVRGMRQASFNSIRWGLEGWPPSFFSLEDYLDCRPRGCQGSHLRRQPREQELKPMHAAIPSTNLSTLSTSTAGVTSLAPETWSSTRQPPSRAGRA